MNPPPCGCGVVVCDLKEMLVVCDLKEMPGLLEKIPLCRNYFNFFLKMNSMSAEPAAFQLNLADLMIW